MSRIYNSWSTCRPGWRLPDLLNLKMLKLLSLSIAILLFKYLRIPNYKCPPWAVQCFTNGHILVNDAVDNDQVNFWSTHERIRSLFYDVYSIRKLNYVYISRDICITNLLSVLFYNVINYLNILLRIAIINFSKGNIS